LQLYSSRQTNQSVKQRKFEFVLYKFPVPVLDAGYFPAPVQFADLLNFAAPLVIPVVRPIRFRIRQETKIPT
jgi:hypothetical protein